jgi:hypothetical protein
MASGRPYQLTPVAFLPGGLTDSRPCVSQR